MSDRIISESLSGSVRKQVVERNGRRLLITTQPNGDQTETQVSGEKYSPMTAPKPKTRKTK